MADNTKNKAEQYRKERKERLAKAAKKNAKNIEKKTAAKSAVKKVVAIVLSAVIVLGCLYGVLNYVGVIQSLVKIGYVKDEHISIAEYQYYYMTAYNNLYNTKYREQYQSYGASTASDYDLSLTPDKQTSTTTDEEGNEITWCEYLRDQTITSIQQVSFLYQQAKEAGLELDDADKKKIDKQIESMRENADTAGKNGDETRKGYSLNAYLRKQYGNAVNTSFVKKQMEKEILISKYQEFKVDELKDGYSAEDISKVYDADPDTYQYVDLRVYQFEVAEADAEAEETDKKVETAAEVKAKAEAFTKGVKDESTFLALAKKENADDAAYDAETNTKASSMQKSSLTQINADLADWAFSNDTKANAVKMVEVKNSQDETKVAGYIVALMVNPKHDTTHATVRHILFKTIDDTTGAALSDEELKAAEDKANKTLAEWKAGDATEDSFADLASELSEDTGTQSNGGLYDCVKGNSVAEFDKWVFDESRKEGDAEVVKTEYGYHIIYFMSNDGSAKDYTIRTNLATQDYQSFVTEQLKSDDYATAFGSRRIAWAERASLKIIKTQVRNINRNQSSSY